MEYNLADLYEAIADAVPDNMALASGDVHHTYADLEKRANRLAHLLVDEGVLDLDAPVACWRSSYCLGWARQRLPRTHSGTPFSRKPMRPRLRLMPPMPSCSRHAPTDAG